MLMNNTAKYFLLQIIYLSVGKSEFQFNSDILLNK